MESQLIRRLMECRGKAYSLRAG